MSRVAARQVGKRAGVESVGILRGRGPGRRRAAVAGVTAEAYTRLRELIVSGALAPGAPLIETDLSVRLGVSRTPVRAALQRLQQEGFVA